MAAMAVTHTAHPMYKSFAGSTACATTDTRHRARVTLANTSGALAMDAAFAMNALSMQRGLGRAMRIAHDSAEVKPVVVSNFAPAFPSLVHCYDVVEALARCISQQVGILQFTITEPRRRPLGLQRIDGNSGFVGDSRQHHSTRRNGAE